jgi:hypothetical protein
MKEWLLHDNLDFDNLKVVESLIPEVNINDMLMRFHVASLNYLDLVIATVRCKGPKLSIHSDIHSKKTDYWPIRDDIVPGCVGSIDISQPIYIFSVRFNRRYGRW